MNKRIIFVRHGESTENIAQDQGEKYDKNKIVLTDKGKTQAIKTGKYLNEIFGKFDKVYTSPATRCIQTAELIINEIGYKRKPEISDLLVEIGYKSNKLHGLPKEESKKIFDNIQLDLPKNKLFHKIKTFRQLDKKLNETENPYDKLELTKLWPEIQKNHLDMEPTTKQVAKNYNKFLKILKKSTYENILVISHGGCINKLQNIICNIDIMNMEINIDVKNIKSNNGNFSNCCILCLGIDKNKYTLVSPANTNHLN